MSCADLKTVSYHHFFRRNLPRALSIAVPIVTAAYIMANVGYFAVMNLNELVDQDKGAPVEGFATNFGRATMGDVGVILLPLCIAASTFGAANGSAFTGSRLYCEPLPTPPNRLCHRSRSTHV